ncbi:MAG: OmpA family protein, partial [Pseudomonadota bacterium]
MRRSVLPDSKADLLAKKRVHFAFDSSTIDEESRAIIEAHAAHLNANPQLKVKLEGHCDERGTREYNLALGERR